jgi:hypothetical protein
MRNIITVFAGRKPNLQILMKYLTQAIELNMIHEVHLWNYTRNPHDDAYVQQLNNPERKVLCKHVQDKGNWGEYYRHYSNAEYTDDVIMKCDDDIVFIDLVKLPSFIRFVRENEDSMLTFANIINNGVSAYYQQNKHALIPTELMKLEYPNGGVCGSLWESGKKATALHEHFIHNYASFLEHNSKESYVQIHSRFSINFFGMRGAVWHKMAGCVQNDEHLLTVEYVNTRKFKNVLYFDFYVSHLSFFRQLETGIDHSRLIDEYDAFYENMKNTRFAELTPIP